MTTPPKASAPYQTQASTGLRALLATLPSGDAGKPYLGDPDAVEAILRTYIAEVLERHAGRDDGSVSNEDAVLGDQHGCHELARIFAGLDPRFTPVPDWNTAGIGAFLRQRLTGIDQVDDSALATDALALQTTFGLLTLEVYQIVADYVDSRDHAAAKERGEELVEDYARLLLGLPASNELDDDPGPDPDPSGGAR